MPRKLLLLGATSAIAQATARLLAGDGDRIFLVARDPERLEIVARDLEIRAADSIGPSSPISTTRSVMPRSSTEPRSGSTDSTR